MVAAAVLALRVFVACVTQPTLEERVSQRLVVTKFDPAADFTSFTTFAVAGTVAMLTSLEAGSAPTQTLDPAVAGPMLQEIASQLTARGYVQVERSAHPDAGVAVTFVNRLNVEVPYGAWWAYGGASPGYWGAPTAIVNAPFTYSTLAWQSGTIVIELDDLRGAGIAPGPTIPMVTALAPDAGGGSVRVSWAALLHGVLGPVGSTLEAPPIDLIRQAFAQSPYLRH